MNTYYSYKGGIDTYGRNIRYGHKNQREMSS